MKQKIIIGFAAIFFILISGLGIFIGIQYSKFKPDYSGVLELGGISSPVSINWDSSGVIHIAGEKTSDVIFAAGFATAKERLWQMEIQRRVASGRLSEIFGSTTLEIDKLFAALGLDSLCESLYLKVSPESRQWMEDYTRGINAYIQSLNTELPVEFVLLKLEPQAWRPQDCLLQNRLMAWLLNFNWKSDLLYWQLKSQLPDRKFNEIWPAWIDAPSIVKQKFNPTGMKKISELKQKIRQILGISGAHIGSNAWVLGPRKTTTGTAMLANDPHLSLQLPSIWIELHLESEDLNVAGFGLPGTPGVVIGRNQNIAWGITNGMIDDSDYFICRTDTVENLYWIDKSPLPLKKRTRILKVKDKQDVYFNIYSTRYGPILNQALQLDPGLPPFALRWVGMDFSDELLTFIRLSRARNWQDFQQALEPYAVPCLNFVYADRQGNIGYQLGGRVPVRSYGNGLIPRDGSTAKNTWTGWIPFNEMPQVYNPASGFVVTANQKITDTNRYYLSEMWEPPFRAERIRQLLLSSDRLSRQDVQKIQSDQLDLLAQKILPILKTELKRMEVTTKNGENLAALLDYWNGEMRAEDVAAGFFAVWQYFLIRDIFLDEMGGELFDTFSDLPNFYLRIFDQVFFRKYSPWFDDITTPAKENRQEIIRRSFYKAMEFFEEKLGPDLENGQWGQLHQLRLEHSLGKVALTRVLFNPQAYPVGGSGTTVNVAAYDYHSPFSVIVGPSFRLIVDWSEPGVYRSILPGGNSGQFLSPFYSNQIRKWLSGQLKKVKYSMPNILYKIELKPITNINILP